MLERASRYRNHTPIPFEACEPGRSGVCFADDQAQAAPATTERGHYPAEPGDASDREYRARGRGYSGSSTISLAPAGRVHPDARACAPAG
jgi:hypothetical protein